jgi:hypothetical protein
MGVSGLRCPFTHHERKARPLQRRCFFLDRET